MPAALAPTARPLLRQEVSPGPPPPEPGFLETVGAGFRTARDDIGQVQRNRLQDAYAPILAALDEQGEGSVWRYTNPLAVVLPFQDTIDHDRVWQAVQRVRERQPGTFADLPATREEFERGVLTRQGERQRDLATVSRGSGVAGFIGAIGTMPFDPVNVATAPIGGGGKTVFQAVLRGAIVNAGIEAAQQPGLAVARERMGEELTAGEAALNVSAAFVFGGLVDGSPKALEAAVTRNWNVLPQGLRDRYVAASLRAGARDWEQGLRMGVGFDDGEFLADFAEAIVGRENLSEAEADALAVARRESGIAAASPFRPDGAGTAAHNELLSEALARITAANPQGAPARAAQPDTPPAPARAAPVVGSNAIEGFMARTRRAESGGSDTARNPRSSAAGRYQFTDSTWLAYYRRRFGATGESTAQILRKKRDGNLQDVLMRDLTNDNAAALHRAGIPVTEGNLYLAHFAGPEGARRLHAADPDASARSALGDAAVNANPFLKDMTAGDVIAWADGKMGGAGVAVRGSGGPTVEGGDEMAALRAEIDALNADSARIAAELGEAGNLSPELARLVDEGVEPVPLADAPEVGAAPRETPAPPLVARRARFNGPDDLVRFVARNGGLSYDGLNEAGRTLGTRGHDLRNSGSLAKFVPGVGPLLRPRGRSLDEMGELLWDAGYFGPPETAARPSETELITLIDEVLRKGEKRYSFFDQAPEAKVATRDGEQLDEAGRSEAEVVDEETAAEARLAYRQLWDDAAGEPLLADEIARAEAVMRDPPEWLDRLDPADVTDARQLAPYWTEVVNRELDAALDDAFLEVEDDFYALIEDQFAAALGRESGEGGSGGAGRAAEPGDAGETGPRGDAGQDAAGDRPAPLADLTPEQRAPYLDPEGPAATAQAESLLHDARADAAAKQTLREFLGDAAETPEGKAASAYVDSLGAGDWPEWRGAFIIGARGEKVDFSPVEMLAKRAYNAGRAWAKAELASPPPRLDLGEAVDRNVAARQAQEAALGAEAPMRAAVDQESTLGLGLFGAADGVRLDAEGEARPLKDLLDELEAEEAEINTIRGCL